MARQIKDADEQDALTGWKKYLHWRPGERKKVKRKANRRERREAKRASQLKENWIP